MLLMIAQHLDEALGLSNLTSMLNQYLPAEHVASSLVTLKQQLPATFTQPTPTAVLVWAMAAIMLLAVLEQVKYQIGRFGKGGKQLPGGVPAVPRRNSSTPGCCSTMIAGRHHVYGTTQARGSYCTGTKARHSSTKLAPVHCGVGQQPVPKCQISLLATPDTCALNLAVAAAGPSYTVPFLGSIVEMVQDPHGFWERQRAYSFPGLSWNSIVTKFTVMVTDPTVIRHVFQHNR
jgi:hypothetical protein